MNRFDRLKELRRLLQDGPPRSKKELAHELRVHPRTVQRDLRELARQGEEPTHSRQQGGFHLPAARSATEPPSFDVALALALASSALRAFSDTGIGERIEMLAAAEKERLPNADRELLEHVASRVTFEGEPHRPVATKVFQALLRALRARRLVHGSYQPVEQVGSQAA